MHSLKELLHTLIFSLACFLLVFFLFYSDTTQKSQSSFVALLLSRKIERLTLLSQQSNVDPHSSIKIAFKKSVFLYFSQHTGLSLRCRLKGGSFDAFMAVVDVLILIFFSLFTFKTQVASLIFFIFKIFFLIITILIFPQSFFFFSQTQNQFFLSCQCFHFFFSFWVWESLW